MSDGRVGPQDHDESRNCAAPGCTSGGAVNLPIHDSVDALCAACRRAIWGRDRRYRIGDRDYHADCFDISLWLPTIREDAIEQE
jgi:hypothetical protein